MVQCRRLGHITLETPDLERMVEYYEQIIGLRVVARSARDLHLATRVGQLALHVREGSIARCARLSFEVAPTLDLDELQNELKKGEVAVEHRSDIAPGVTRTLSFAGPAGIMIDLFARSEFVSRAPAIGVAPMKLGHTAFVVEDPKKLATFYGQQLGFRVSDWVEDFFVFMRCGSDHHTVNFLQGDVNRLHHYAFEMRDTNHLIESCDVLGQYNIPIIWGPVRHGPGHNVASYHIAPDGLVVELFSEMDRVIDEELGYFDPRPWHDDLPQRPKVWPGNRRRDIWGPPIPADFLNAGSSLLREPV